jgi:hypothetical protein
MKKVITLCVLSFGILFIAGCSQQQISKKESVTPAPVIQQPTQPVEEKCEPLEENCLAGTKCVYDLLKKYNVCKQILKIGQECYENTKTTIDMCDRSEGLACKEAGQSCGTFSTDGAQECFVNYACAK